ncbi:MAG: transposase [Deltaproteobacteria bacterium]|jgi:hypothetical protein|nr:transposase [Deltaproteobacteria bacterium]
MSDSQDSSEIIRGLSPPELNGCIIYDNKRSGLYARFKKTVVVDGTPTYKFEPLGKVLNKEEGLFSNSKLGLFNFDLINGYRNHSILQDPVDFIYPFNVSVIFGDVWVLDEMFKKFGLDKIIDEFIPEHSNFLKALIAYRLTENNVIDHAKTWYLSSYAQVLYPNINLDSPRISEFHAKLGEEFYYRKFFESYLKLFAGDGKLKDKISLPILIDSTGLQNDINMDLTAVSNHNGVINNEMRLIYVADKTSKLPLLYHYVNGSVIDNVTLVNIINLLNSFDINIQFILMDTGYSNISNISKLVELKIPFLTRLPKNRIEHKELIKMYSSSIERPKNFCLFEKRKFFGIKTQITFEGEQLFAYVLEDVGKKFTEFPEFYAKHKDEPDSDNLISDSFESAGKFILLSSNEYDIYTVIDLYHERENIEQIFDITKTYAKILPLRVHSIQTVRGILLESFLATTLYAFLSQQLSESKFCTKAALAELKTVTMHIYEEASFLDVLTKRQKQVFTDLNLTCHFSEERGMLTKKDSLISNIVSARNGIVKRGHPKGSVNKKKKNLSIIQKDNYDRNDTDSNITPIFNTEASAPESLTAHNTSVQENPKRGRGRPKGSKNKDAIKLNTVLSSTVQENPKRGRGRPKGSKNKVKMTN